MECLQLDECLGKGKPFVEDKTNPEKVDRQRYISRAKERGYNVIGIFFQSLVQDCIDRNENRENAVPSLVIPST